MGKPPEHLPEIDDEAYGKTDGGHGHANQDGQVGRGSSLDGMRAYRQHIGAGLKEHVDDPEREGGGSDAEDVPD
jgi:hypothetical protein